MVKTYPVPCTKEEMDALIEASADNIFYYVLFSLAKTTGRRLSEYFFIKVEDIDFPNKSFTTEVLKGKRRVRAPAILRDDIAILLKNYILTKGLKPNDYVFQEVSRRQIQYTIKKYAKRANVPHNVSFHNFRHYFVTSLRKQNWNYQDIAKLTGHSSSNTLYHYDHSTIDDVKQAATHALATI